MQIPDGIAGIRETLKVMRKIVRDWRKSVDLRDLALAYARACPQKSFTCEATQIFEFVRDRIRYVKDINDVETIHTPDQILKRGQGDCDDKAILLAAMLESIGHPCKFVAVGVDGGPISHVFVTTKIGRRWFGMEPTEPWPFGVIVPGITQRIEVYI